MEIYLAKLIAEERRRDAMKISRERQLAMAARPERRRRRRRRDSL